MTTERIAEAGVTVTIGFFSVSLAAVNLVVQITAGLVAIAVGVMTFLYYRTKYREGQMHIKWDQEDRQAAIDRANDEEQA